jgi:hypothetical protein
MTILKNFNELGSFSGKLSIMIHLQTTPLCNFVLKFTFHIPEDHSTQIPHTQSNFNIKPLSTLNFFGDIRLIFEQKKTVAKHNWQTNSPFLSEVFHK